MARRRRDQGRAGERRAHPTAGQALQVLLVATLASPLLGAWVFAAGYVLCLLVVLVGCVMEPGPLLEERQMQAQERARLWPATPRAIPPEPEGLTSAVLQEWARRQELPPEVVRELLAAPAGEPFARAHRLEHRFESEGGRLVRLALRIDLVARLPRPGRLGFRLRFQDAEGQTLEASSKRYRDSQGRHLFACSLCEDSGGLFARRGISYKVPVDGHVRLPEGGGTIRAELHLDTPGERVFLARVEGLAGEPGGGVELLAPPGPRPEGLVECPVCGGPLETGEPERRCPRCETPHHRDCWRFNGGCSTFGCQGGSAG